MDERPVIPAPIYPCHMRTLGIPNDSALKRAYEVYKPSTETVQLLSEQNRTIYSELFIENERLGPLKDLCAAVVARFFGPSSCALVAESPLLLQVYYDALDVDLPLDKCHHITEERYWKRVVLEKHQDKTLAIKRNVKWKNLGVTLKLVELVEQCPVEYFPEEEIKELASKVREFVQELHIKRLQSLRESYYKKYFLADSEESSTEESSSEETIPSIILSVKEERESSEEVMLKSESLLSLEANLLAHRVKFKEQRQNLKEAEQKARESKREAKQQRREAKSQAVENPEKPSGKKIPYTMFDIKVSDSESDGEDRIVDRRNKYLYLSRIKNYKYPSQDCHHINLKFVQYLSYLETFILEFWGPLQGRYFHKRHHRFSLKDIQNLSLGLRHLSLLKVFRLRNSCMDVEKLDVLCKAVAVLPCLETLDFGFDQLNDDCGFIFAELFQATKSLQSLELESNFLGEQSLNLIGKALKHYNATELLYLGLARNPLTDQALHALVAQILDTNHIQQLNIRAAKFLTESGIACCVANELLRNHTVLAKLDICALPVPPMAAEEIVKSLEDNKTILEINCTECCLDLETEIAINVLLQRNKYISEHYYLGDPTVTNEEITQWLNRTRNPVLLKVLAEREADRKCLENRSLDSKTLALSHHSSLDLETSIYETHLSDHSSLEIQIPAEKPTERFTYPANDFSEEEFLAHVQLPGPQERYYYFKSYKKKYLVKDNPKNVSLI